MANQQTGNIERISRTGLSISSIYFTRLDIRKTPYSVLRQFIIIHTDERPFFWRWVCSSCLKFATNPEDAISLKDYKDYLIGKIDCE